MQCVNILVFCVMVAPSVKVSGDCVDGADV